MGKKVKVIRFFIWKRDTENSWDPRDVYIIFTSTVWPKKQPLPNYQKIVLNRIKACQW